jgi:hypothetical protein
MHAKRCRLHGAKPSSSAQSARSPFWGRRVGLTRLAGPTPFPPATGRHSRAAFAPTLPAACASRRAAVMGEALGDRGESAVRRVPPGAPGRRDRLARTALTELKGPLGLRETWARKALLAYKVCMAKPALRVQWARRDRKALRAPKESRERKASPVPREPKVRPALKAVQAWKAPLD